MGFAGAKAGHQKPEFPFRSLNRFAIGLVRFRPRSSHGPGFETDKVTCRLEYLVRPGSARQVPWIHGSRDASVRAFRDQVEAFHKQQERFQRHISYGQIEESELQEDYYPGIANLGQLKESAIRPHEG